MRRRQKIAVILQLMNEMWYQSKWCSESTIQMHVFFLQELMKVPLEFEFVLYRGAPFSFELSYLFPEMNSAKSIELVPQPRSRPQIKVTERGVRFYSAFDHDIAQYKTKIAFVPTTFRNKGVDELALVAIGFYVTMEFENCKNRIRERADRLVELEPHFDLSEAVDAINEVDEIVDMADAIGTDSHSYVDVFGISSHGKLDRMTYSWKQSG